MTYIVSSGALNFTHSIITVHISEQKYFASVE